MPFDPTKPVEHTDIDAAELRNQFNGLKDLIDWNTLPNKPTPVADGTYIIGTGTVQNGTITVVNGIITAMQEASDGNPNAAVFVGNGFEDTPCNGNWFLLGNNGKNTYRNEASNRVCSADIQVGRWYIGAAEWPNQGNQSYFLNTTDDPPLGSNWSSNFWLLPGTTSAA